MRGGWQGRRQGSQGDKAGNTTSAPFASLAADLTAITLNGCCGPAPASD